MWNVSIAPIYFKENAVRCVLDMFGWASAPPRDSVWLALSSSERTVWAAHNRLALLAPIAPTHILNLTPRFVSIPTAHCPIALNATRKEGGAHAASTATRLTTISIALWQRASSKIVRYAIGVYAPNVRKDTVCLKTEIAASQFVIIPFAKIVLLLTNVRNVRVSIPLENGGSANSPVNNLY
jgi:hypothetical protein